MLESILIILGIISVCLVLLSPFYFFRKKETSTEVNIEVEYEDFPLWKGILYALAEGCLFILLLLYFLLKEEIGLEVSALVFVVFFAAIIFLHTENRKIRLKFSKNAKFGLAAYKKVQKH